jgi:hypothetical protein
MILNIILQGIFAKPGAGMWSSSEQSLVVLATTPDNNKLENIY